LILKYEDANYRPKGGFLVRLDFFIENIRFNSGALSKGE